PMKRLLPGLLAALSLVGLPAVAPAQPADCVSLPTSAPRPRPCNPRQECLQQVASMKGEAREKAQQDCNRMPTSGTCYGPETYNPQAECRARQRR
ncbi:MAG TPA: hypothetical protein VFX28_13595, partial [Methylomirabilota bacterium]|nr:hypothetical protein [Methylomirabilota bacterium]